MLRIQPYYPTPLADLGLDIDCAKLIAAARRQGYWLRAVGQLERAASKPGAPVEVLYLLARLHMKLREYGLARETLQTALDREPGYQMARSLMAIACINMKAFEEGREHLQIAISLDPRDEVAWGRLATCFHDQGKTGACIAALQRQVRLDPRNAGAARMLDELLRE